MATIKYSALVTDIRGKFNGSQLSKSRAGSLLQRKGSQKIAPSQKQLASRLNLANVGSYWRSLTTEQQAENNANALNYPYIDKYGDTRYYTGYQLLLRSNMNRVTIGQTLISVVPATPPDSVVIQAEFNNIGYYPVDEQAAGTFITAVSGSLVDRTFIWYTSAPVSAGVNNYTGKWNIVLVQDATNPDLFIGFGPESFPVAMPGDYKYFWRIDVVDNASGVVVGSLITTYLAIDHLLNLNIVLDPGVAYILNASVVGNGQQLPPSWGVEVGYQTGTAPGPVDPPTSGYTSLDPIPVGSSLVNYSIPTTDPAGSSKYTWFRFIGEENDIGYHTGPTYYKVFHG